VALSHGKTPEVAKREEGGENAVSFCGEAALRAPRCPLKLSEQAGTNGLESHTVAFPWGDLGIHTKGPAQLESRYCSLVKFGRSQRNTNARGTFVFIHQFCIFRARTSDRFDVRVRRIWLNLTMRDGAWLSSATTTSTRVRHEICIVSLPALSNGRRQDAIDYSWLQHAHYPLCDLSASCQKWKCLRTLLLPPLLVVGRVIMVRSSC